MHIQVYRILDRTQMAGPGWRFCLWVQGCSRHCKGCEASDTWSPYDGTSMNTAALIDQITSTPDIEGVSFLGGEPFEQAEALALIAEQVRAAGLSVVSFSGYTYEELSVGSFAMQRLLNATDLLIDGPFVQEEQSFSRAWVGSNNQRFVFLTDRYNENDVREARNQIEVRIASNGAALINGMGDFSRIRELLR